MHRINRLLLAIPLALATGIGIALFTLAIGWSLGLAPHKSGQLREFFLIGAVLFLLVFLIIVVYMMIQHCKGGRCKSKTIELVLMVAAPFALMANFRSLPSDFLAISLTTCLVWAFYWALGNRDEIRLTQKATGEDEL